MNKTEELILTIFKTHSGEWLSPAKVRAIVSAITGHDVLLPTVRRAITCLTRQCKLVRSKTASAYKVFEG
ncbi:hypothetical protein BDD43_5137 [Mucilaginibacter gracilis]|uniref:Uncharacterized protein n=1 Tax=Mucilaginibacter gracilis TaxID=423350 RepID=A0A495J909_9SPHI|nr:hypothetical protein [Mucilaginibacter gracilis]RKR84884.1 hypothetical protein BDD43_5137 [Mucilaginibacter gracilis]